MYTLKWYKLDKRTVSAVVFLEIGPYPLDQLPKMIQKHIQTPGSLPDRWIAIEKVS